MTRGQAGETSCEDVDLLAGAAALGALEPGEGDAMVAHLQGCRQPHSELRDLLGAGVVLEAALLPVTPSPGLRARILTSAAATAQNHRPDVSTPTLSRRAWLGWLSPGWARGLATAGAVAVIGLASWNLSLQAQVARQAHALAAVAEALAGGQAAYEVRGSGGSGVLVDTEGRGATFLATSLAALPADRIYELWLLDAGGSPLAVGVIERADSPLTVAALEADLAGYATFAVTIEPTRLDAPTCTPVMAGSLGG